MPGDVALSVVTYGELVHGLVKRSSMQPSAAKELEEFVGLIGVMPLPIGAGMRYGEIRSFLESNGQIIGNNDLWIAAHAVSAGLTLVTNNEREFRRVPDLKIENWAK
jgi:tRNA(fMet)-specific endonuclease VapC